MLIPMIAVITSINKVISKVDTDKIAPLMTGDKNIIIEDNVLLIPLILIKCSCGTIWGIIAFTAGVWIPVPAERIANTANSIQTFWCPVKNVIAKSKVVIAITASANIIIFFRLYRSIHTPANSEMNICGRNPHNVEIVSIFPDEVVSVIYHIIPYCTSDDPNKEIVCAVKNRAIEFFQLNSFIKITTFPSSNFQISTFQTFSIKQTWNKTALKQNNSKIKQRVLFFHTALCLHIITNIVSCL